MGGGFFRRCAPYEETLSDQRMDRDFFMASVRTLHRGVASNLDAARER